MSSMKNFEDEHSKNKALGLVKLVGRHREILILPQRSSHPDDPLNWSKKFKYYLTCLACFGLLISTFLAAGPVIAIEQIAEDLGGNPNESLYILVPRVTIFFTTTALVQGLSTLLWQPFIKKFGRRPIYITSFSGYFLAVLWSGLSREFNNELAARIILGFFSGGIQCLGPITVCDLFFLHERATAMSIFNFSIASGVPIGMIASGLIINNNKTSWRNIYFLGTLFIGFLVLLIVFTFPETAYNRIPTESINGKNTLSPSSTFNPGSDDVERAETTKENGPSPSNLDSKSTSPTLSEVSIPPPAPKKAYFETLDLYSGETYTAEPFLKILIRPLLLLLHPVIIWSSLIQCLLLTSALTISILLPNDFATVYNFSTFKSLACFSAGILGAILAVPAGGQLGESVTMFLTYRTGGIRVPEFRLPVLGIAMLVGPVGLILYGVGLGFEWNFLVVVFGFGMVWFSVGQAITVSLIYTIDAYPGLTGEVVTAQLILKSFVAFFLSTFINSHMNPSKRILMVSIMAGISFFILSLAFPMFIWGTRMRRAALNWKCSKFLYT